MMYLWRLQRAGNDYDEYDAFIVSAESAVSAHWVVLASMFQDDYSYWRGQALKWELMPWWNYERNEKSSPAGITIQLIGVSASSKPQIQLASFNAG
jgi:hypothetical protein